MDTLVKKNTQACKHCGLTFKPSEQELEFCCNGCRYVYQLIHDEGLNKFYSLKDTVLPAVSSSIFSDREYDWLEKQATLAEQKDTKTAKLTLNIQGIACVGCVWLIERFFLKQPGAVVIDIYSQTGQITIQWEPKRFSLIDFAKGLQRLGYFIGPCKKASKKTNSKLTTRMGLCAAFAMNAMLFTLPGYLGMPSAMKLSSIFQLLSFLCATFSLLIGGSYFIKRALFSLTQKIVHMDLPIALGIVISYIGSVLAWRMGDNRYSYFDFTSIFIFLMLLGRWVQQIAIERNNNQLLKLDPRPHSVIVYPSKDSPPEKAGTYPVDTLATGVFFSIQSGQTVPVDAKLLGKDAHFNLQWISGESEVCTFHPEDKIPAGALYIGTQIIRLMALQGWQDSLFSKLTEKTNAKTYRNPFIEKLIKYYTLGVLCIAVLGGIAWQVTTHELGLSLQIALSVLVVSCPCALGISFPIVNERLVTFLRSVGVHIQNQNLFSKISQVRSIIFDKTGTLTHETLYFENQNALERLTSKEKTILLEMASFSLHPVSRAIREALLTQGVTLKHYNPASMDEIVGTGIYKHDGDIKWMLGKDLDKTNNNYSTVFKCNNKVLAHFSFCENVRSDVVEEVFKLRQMGYTVYILSGDNPLKVERMATQIGIPRELAIASASPEEKAEWVSSIDHNDTLMIGDGANDSLVFDKAYCCATPVIDRGFLEHKSDFYFLGRGISGIRKILEYSQKRKTIYKILFGQSVLYNLAAISACLLGMVTPIAAAIIMPLSSLLSMGLAYFCLNGLVRQDPINN